MAKKVQIQLKKSLIGSNQTQRQTVKALGLKKTNSVVTQESTPQIEGMIHRVRHLVEVTDAE